MSKIARRWFKITQLHLIVALSWRQRGKNILFPCTYCKHEHKHKIHTYKWEFQSATVAAETIVSACGLIRAAMSAQGQSWSRNFQQGSCCCSTIFRKMSPTCLQGWGCQLLGYLIWVKPSSTTDDNNPPYDSLLCHFGTDGSNIWIIVDVLSESYNWSQNKNILIWFPEKKKSIWEHSAAPLATTAKSRKGSSLMFLAGWGGRVREHIITDSKQKSSD